MKYDLVFIGDSITKGTFTKLGDTAPNSIATPNFSEMLKEKLHAKTMINYGENGVSYSSLSPVLPEHSIVKKCSAFEDGKNIFLLTGTNDFGTGVPLGNSSDERDISFFGAVHEVFEEIKNKNPQSSIFVVLPFRRFDEDKNSLNLSLDSYREALRVKANTFGFYVIDGSAVSFQPNDKEYRDTYMPDGVHPNEMGHEMIADFLFAQVEGKMTEM